MTRAFAVTALSCSLMGCDGAASYSGDGKLVDRGLFSSNARYVLRLGTVDLSKPSKAVYLLSGLPDERFVVGFWPNGDLNKQTAKARVRISLVRNTGEKVFEAERTLANWVWSSEPFVYLRGNEVEGPRGNDGSFEMKEVGVGADG